MPAPPLSRRSLFALAAGCALATVGLAWWFQPGCGGLAAGAGVALLLAGVWWRRGDRLTGWRQHAARSLGLALTLGPLTAVGLGETMALSEWLESGWPSAGPFPLDPRRAWPGPVGVAVAAALVSWLAARRRPGGAAPPALGWPHRAALVAAVAALGLSANWYAAGWLNVAEAAEHGELAKLRYVLRSRPGAAHARGFYGWTALHWAARAAQVPAARRLLAAGADVNAPTQRGQTALHVAAEGGQVAMVELLLAAGARVQARDQNGLTPLHAAAHYRQAPAARRLLAAGAAVNARTPDGLQPLHLAAARGAEELTRLLLAAGGDARSLTQTRQTPLHFAALHDAPVAAQTLLAAGADVNARTRAGATPLHVAALSGCPVLAGVLLAAGATINARDAQGATPLDCTAARRADADPERQQRCAAVLREHGGQTGAALDVAGARP